VPLEKPESHSFGYIPRVGLPDQMANLCLDFSEVSKFFSRVVALVCIPTSSGLGELGLRTQGLSLARQMLYYLSHSPIPF
jgi:hypothetical protein